MGFFLTAILFGIGIVLSDLLAPKPKDEQAKPTTLGDFRVPTATENRPVPIIWGTVQLSGPNVVWYDDLRVEKITKKIKTGIFSSQNVANGERYSLGIQQVWCYGPLDGPDDGLLRLWIGDKLVEDYSASKIEHGDTFTVNQPDLYDGDDTGNGGVVGDLQFFAGTPNQSASSYLSAFQKIPPTTGATPTYPDICYTAPLSEPTYLGKSTSIQAWKMELRRIPNGLALDSVNRIVDGGANPANVIYEILTNDDWGYGLPASAIDSTTFVACALTLKTEGNGFSFNLDRVEQIEETLNRVERQIDGLVYQDPITGKYKLRLTRKDYNPATIVEITDSDVLEIVSMNHGAWIDTQNEVSVPFADPDDEYRESFGFAQDMANQLILGAVVPTTISHPGICSGYLANKIAWRELLTLSIPLKVGTLRLPPKFYGLSAGDPIKLTIAALGLDEFEVRIRNIEKGGLLDRSITIEWVQSIFDSVEGSFAPPSASAWTEPESVLAPYPTNDQIAFEAPRAFTSRDPETASPYSDKIFAGARRSGTESTVVLVERDSSGTPTGSYSDAGEAYAFLLAGELSANLGLTASQPETSIVLTPAVDTQAAIIAAFPDVNPTVSELGTELSTICLIGDEFILVSSAQASGANVQLNGVYRGVCDSVQAEHSAGDRVYLLFAGGIVSETSIDPGNNVDAKLIPRGLQGRLAVASATAISFAMNNRTRRPYPPAAFDLNGTTLDTTLVDIAASGTGDDLGVLIDEIVRRDFRTSNEVGSLLADAEAIDPTFPATNSTEVEIRAKDGATVLFTETGIVATSYTMRQLDILEGLDTTALPSSLTIEARQSHTFEGVVYKSLDWLAVTFTVDSDLVGTFAFGVLSASGGEVGPYVVLLADTGLDHDFNLSTTFAGGPIEWEINNSGSWTTLISAGGTTGTIPGASCTTGDEIRLRWSASGSPIQKLLVMDVAATVRGYAVLTD